MLRAISESQRVQFRVAAMAIIAVRTGSPSDTRMIEMLKQRQPLFRSKKWLNAVRSIENCVLCGAYGVQAAHRNFGKSMSQKTDDCLCAALCDECHRQIDNGGDLTREERRALLDRAICDTIAQLARMGLIDAKGAA
ncbi:hypothetical protein ACT1UE_000539 [Pseudomonas aeruginosa]